MFRGCVSTKDGTGDLLSSVPVEFKDVLIYNPENKTKSILSSEELSSDCAVLKYLVETAYAGYDAAAANGLDMDTAVQHIEAAFSGQQQIERRKFVNVIESELRPCIRDSHFMLSTWNYRCSLNPAYNIYFSNTYVRKDGDTLSVCRTDNEALSVGCAYTDSKDTLFYYPAAGKDVYRIGVMASGKTGSMDIHIKDTAFTLPVRTDSSIEVRNADAIKYHELMTNDSVYAGISSFMLPEEGSQFRRGAELVFDKYAALGVRYRNKKNFIIDLRSNTGGVSVYSAALLYSLYGKVNSFSRQTEKKLYAFEDNFSCSEYIQSPAIIQAAIAWNKNMHRTKDMQYYECLLKSQKQNPVKTTFLEPEKPLRTGKNNFDGQILILTDRNTCSAAEITVLMARSLFGKDKKVTVIGENTRGCLQYVSCYNYQLPHSRIVVQLASADYAPKLADCESWHGEGKGMYPDCWATGDDLLETIVLVTGDEELRSKLANIAYGLL
jgi:hypothetical protein